MSLSAVVYRNRKSLGIDAEAEGAKKDPTTGEYYFDSPQRAFPQDFFIATDWQIGNVSSVAELRLELETLTGKKDLLIIEKCLYSGSHSGDLIELELLTPIETETLEILHRFRGSVPAGVEKFLSAMLDTIQVARRENNPIVFV